MCGGEAGITDGEGLTKRRVSWMAIGIIELHMTATVETSEACSTFTTGHLTNSLFTGEVEDMTKAMGENAGANIPIIHLNRGRMFNRVKVKSDGVGPRKKVRRGK